MNSEQIILEALVALVKHDVAQDKREGVPHCLELEQALDALRGAGVAV